MTGQRTLSPSRSHARARRFGFRARMADLADRLRGHSDLPAPAADLQDDDDGMDMRRALEELEALEAIEGPAVPWLPAPTWDGVPATAGNPLPALDRSYVPMPPPAEVIAFAPLTEEAVIYDALGGDTRAARRCGHCGARDGQRDFCWREDAFLVWSCPDCQAQPGWRAPSLPGMLAATADDDDWWYGMPEMGILARSALGTDPRAVRQRPDGRWVAAILVGGRRKVLGSFASKEEAEVVYGGVLDVFAARAGVAA